MRFLINGADAFDVPETCLRKRASSLLTAVTACSSGDVRQLDPGAARLAGWGPGLGEAIERFFEDPDDFSLPPNVELAAFGGVADWLRLELDLGARCGVPGTFACETRREARRWRGGSRRQRGGGGHAIAATRRRETIHHTGARGSSEENVKTQTRLRLGAASEDLPAKEGSAGPRPVVHAPAHVGRAEFAVRLRISEIHGRLVFGQREVRESVPSGRWRRSREVR